MAAYQSNPFSERKYTSTPCLSITFTDMVGGDGGLEGRARGGLAKIGSISIFEGYAAPILLLVTFSLSLVLFGFVSGPKLSETVNFGVSQARTLVIYVYSGSDPEYERNLQFFVREAIKVSMQRS